MMSTFIEQSLYKSPRRVEDLGKEQENTHPKLTCRLCISKDHVRVVRWDAEDLKDRRV